MEVVSRCEDWHLVFVELSIQRDVYKLVEGKVIFLKIEYEFQPEY